MMYHYMRALEYKFSGIGKFQELNEKTKENLQPLVSGLPKEQREQLINLSDLESKLQEKVALSRFVEGFRLALGIAHELGMEEPYLFLEDEEQRMMEAGEIY